MLKIFVRLFAQSQGLSLKYTVTIDQSQGILGAGLRESRIENHAYRLHYLVSPQTPQCF